MFEEFSEDSWLKKLLIEVDSAALGSIREFYLHNFLLKEIKKV